MQILNIPHTYYAEHFSKFTLSLFASGRYINSYVVFNIFLYVVKNSTNTSGAVHTRIFSPRVAHLQNESAASLSSELGSHK